MLLVLGLLTLMATLLFIVVFILNRISFKRTKHVEEIRNLGIKKEVK